MAEFSWGKLTHTENPPKGLKEFQRYGTWPQVVERLSVETPIIESKPDHSAIGTELEIKILGKLFKATVIPESPYDPDNKALRA